MRIRILTILIVIFVFSTLIGAQTKSEQQSDAAKEKAETNKYDKMMAKLANLKAAREESLANPDSAESHYNLGCLLLEESLGYEEAVELFNRAINLKPDYAEAYFGLGRANSLFDVYNSKVDYNKKARELYQQAIQIKPDYAEAHYYLGQAYISSNTSEDKYIKATYAFREAIRLKPDYAQAYNGLGHVSEKMKLYEEAVEAYKKAISIDPVGRYALSALASLYTEMARYEEAIKIKEKFVEAAPDDYFHRFDLGALYAKVGRSEDAIDIYKKAINIHFEERAEYVLKHPSYKTSMHHKLGDLYVKLGRYGEAIEPCREAIRIDPYNIRAYEILTDAYMKLGQGEEAIATLKQAINEMPDTPIFYFNIGLLYLDFGDKKSALVQHKILADKARASKAKVAEKRKGTADDPLSKISKMKNPLYRIFAEALLEKINKANTSQ